MKALKIERIGPREEYRFSLVGVIDTSGARSLDRLLFECQARGARDVHIDFSKVRSVCTLGGSVLARQGRVYEQTERRIHVSGLNPEIRAALVGVDAIVYETNAPSQGAPGPATATHVPASPAPEPTAAGTPLDEEARTAPASGVETPPAVGEPVAAPATVQAAPAAADPPAPSDPDVAQLQAKLKRKILEFRNLFEIARALNLALDLDEVLNLFGLSVMGQFGVERLAIFLADPHREGILVPRQVRGFAHDHFRDFTIGADAIRAAAAARPFFDLEGLQESEGAADTAEALRSSGFEWGVALWVRRDLEGVLLLGVRGSRRGFLEDERDLLTTLAHQAAVAISNARYHRMQEERNLGLVRGMMSLIESRDPYAKGSTERVVRYVTATARLLDYPRESLKGLIYGAVLRDIGMITVSHLILKNPAHLSEEEWALIRQHPVRGAQILEEMNLPRDVIDVVLNHHERWGGEGYPHGIKGTEIPLGARIVSLVDAYVAMTAERPYRRALHYEKARQVIAENWGTPFDPAIVDVFLSVLEKIEKRSRMRGSTPASSTDSDAPAPRAELDPLGSGATIPMESRT
jgi:anti-anti-sigma regulatory factor